MKRVFLGTLLLLSCWSIAAQAQESQVVIEEAPETGPTDSPLVDGVVETKLTELRPDVVVREESIKVGLPAYGPMVEYVFTDHGATLRHARLLDPKLTRDPLPPAPD